MLSRAGAHQSSCYPQLDKEKEKPERAAERALRGGDDEEEVVRTLRTLHSMRATLRPVQRGDSTEDEEGETRKLEKVEESIRETSARIRTRLVRPR
jgi:hypothetical protein